MKKNLKKIVSLLLVLFLSVLVYSEFGVTDIRADSTYELKTLSGIWTSVDGGKDISGVGTNQIKWGKPSTSGNQSGMKFVGSEQQTFQEDEYFILGTFTHSNWPVYNAANGVTLRISLEFAEPIPISTTDEYYFEIDETPNSKGSCPPWQVSSTPCDDMVVFPNISSEQTFFIGNKDCVLEIVGIANSAQDSDVLPYFITEESKNSTAYLVGTLSCEFAPAACGELHGNDYDCGLEEEDWETDSFCLVGDPEPLNPSFPLEGETTEWECVNDEERVSCSAIREPSPICGSYDRIFEYDEATDWPSGGEYCSLGTNSSSPDFPDPGQEVTWECLNSGCSVSCKAERIYPKPWISTRGGLVYSGGNVKLSIQEVLYTDVIANIAQTYTKIVDEEVELSTELLTVGGDVLDLQSRKYFYDLLNYNQRLATPWYQNLLDRAEKVDPQGENWTLVENEKDFNFNLDICETDQHVYFVENNLNVNPEEYEFESSTNGCIFVVKENIYIKQGDYKSEGAESPQYDIVRGYFISDGTVYIEEDEGTGEINDGLKIVGGIFATGSEISVEIDRGLQLKDNLTHPALILFHDTRYLDISRRILGDSFGGYIRDLGFKE
jgi:hypothetical protein